MSKDGVLVGRPVYPIQVAYRAGTSTGTAVIQVVHKREKSLNPKEIVLGVFLDIEGSFDSTSFDAIYTPATQRGRE